MGLLDGLIASLPDAKGSAPSSKSNTGGGEIESLLRNKAAEYDIDPDLFVGLAKRESGLRPDAKNTGSTAGGLFQFIDGTWNRYGNKKDKFDPEANADAAARMLRDHLGMFDGDYNKALAAHHVGAGKAASALTDRRVGDKDVSTQQWLSEIYKHAGRENPLATPRGAFADAEAGVGGYDQIRQGQIAQAASDESPVSTSLKRGMKGLTHSAGLAIDNMMGDSQGAAQRIIDKQAFDQANPAPSSVQKFGRDWDALAEDDYSGMFGTILKNPAGSFNMMLEQTPNSLPGMAFQTIAGVAGRGLMALGPVGAAAGLGLQGLSAFAGNFLPEGGAFIEEQLHKSGVDTSDMRAVAKWIEENRGKNFKGGATKAGVISAVDGVTGWMGMKMLAGPSVRFAKAEKDFFAKNGVNVTDSAALQAARAGDAYKAAMQPFAADLVKATEGFGMLKRGVGATALDAMGEGVGEYAGTYAATGDASIKDAVLEGVMGVGQGAAMAGAGYGIGKLSGPDQAMEELRKLATANIAPAEAKPNSPLSNAAQAAQSADPITEALKPISERFADRTLYDQIRSHPNLGPDAMNQILSAYRVATNTNMDPMARQAAVERLGEFFRLFDNQPNFTMGTGESAPEQASKPGALLSGPDGAESESQPPLIDPLSGRLIGGPSAPALMAPAEEDIGAKRAALLDRVLATNPENPNRTFDRALRLEGFRDSAFTDTEKERIAQFAAMRSSPMSSNGLAPLPSQGRYQHLSDMLDAGWEPADRGQLVGPNGETYNLKGAGEAQFVRNKLNQKAGNGSQSHRGGSQGGTDQGDFGVGGAGANGPVPQGGGNGYGQANAIPDTGATAGTIQSSEAVGNGGQPNNPLGTKVTEPENKQRLMLNLSGEAVETQAIHDIEYGELPGRIFFTRVREDGLFNVVDEHSGHSVFSNSPTELDAINGLRAFINKAGADVVRAKLEEQPKLQSYTKQDTAKPNLDSLKTKWKGGKNQDIKTYEGKISDESLANHPDIPVVSVSTKFFSDKSPGEMQDASIGLINDAFENHGGYIVNIPSGVVITTTKSNAKHATNLKSSKHTPYLSHFAVSQKIGEILENAVLADGYVSKKDSQPYTTIYRMYAAVNIDGVAHRVKITLKQSSKDGLSDRGAWFYDHELTDVSKEPLPSRNITLHPEDVINKPEAKREDGGALISVRDLLSGVKRDSDGTTFMLSLQKQNGAPSGESAPLSVSQKVQGAESTTQAAQQSVAQRSYVRTYKTKSGKIGARIEKVVGPAGKVFYNYTGEWGAGSGHSLAQMDKIESMWRKEKRGYTVVEADAVADQATDDQPFKDGKASKADVIRELAKINEQMPDGYQAADGATGLELLKDGKVVDNVYGLSRVNGYGELLHIAKMLHAEGAEPMFGRAPTGQKSSALHSKEAEVKNPATLDELVGAVASANRTLDSTIAIHEQKQAESNKEESAKQEPAQEQEKDAEPKADTSEFEHAGYKIYRSRVNVAGEVKDYWAVQTEDNRQKGKVGFGDALHETKETAMQAANLQSQRADLAERNRIAAEEKAKSEEQAKAEKEADTYNGFLDGKTPAKKGLIRKALSKEMRINGVVSTLRNYVESSLSSGKLEISTYEEDKIKPLSRTQFNRMDNRQQEAHEKKVREGGKVTVYEVNGYDLGKTAYDYAQHLLSQKDQSVSQQKTDASKEPKAIDTKPESDWLGELFSYDSSQVQPVEQKKNKKVDLSGLVGKLREFSDKKLAEANDWASRQYKQNNTKVSFEGDGPTRNESMSISAANESRRNRNVDSLQHQAQMASNLANRIERGFDVQAEIEQAIRNAESDIKRDGKARFGGTRESQIEAYISNSMLGDANYGFGEGTLSNLIRKSYEESQQKTDEAPKYDNPAAPSARAIEVFDALLATKNMAGYHQLANDSKREEYRQGFYAGFDGKPFPDAAVKSSAMDDGYVFGKRKASPIIYDENGNVVADKSTTVSLQENDKPAYADDAELQDALSHLGDVLGDVFGAKLNITGKQYGASDLLPAMSKVIELLIKKGFKSFRESVGAATNAMRGNANTKGFVDQITARQWKAAYNSVAEFHEGTDSEEDVAKYSAEQVQKIIALPEKIKEAEQKTDHGATPGQKEAGNYPKGKFQWHGLTIAIETAKGEDRTDKETNGDKWRVKMPATYGYILGTVGADKDHVDVFIGDKPESQRVYVINQTKPGSAEFDEHKVMLGYDSEGAAIGDYLLSFSGTFGGSVLGSVSGPYAIDDFKHMLESNRFGRAKPISDRLAYVNPRVEENTAEQQPPGVTANGAKENAAAERLAQLLDKMDQVRMDRNTPEGSAKGIIRSAIEELRKERSVGNIPGLLDTAAQRLFRQHSAFSDVVSEVAESLRVVDKYAETVAKVKAKQEERNTPTLDKITVTRSATLDGKAVEYDQQADEALKEIDSNMDLAKRLLECLAA